MKTGFIQPGETPDFASYFRTPAHMSDVSDLSSMRGMKSDDRSRIARDETGETRFALSSDFDEDHIIPSVTRIDDDEEGGATLTQQLLAD